MEKNLQNGVLNILWVDTNEERGVGKVRNNNMAEEQQLPFIEFDPEHTPAPQGPNSPVPPDSGAAGEGSRKPVR
jgi:hypothetical protein